MPENKNIDTLHYPVVQVLWTGGWDSTFRIVELSRQSVTIKAVYVQGDNRRSEGREKAAMEKIRTLLMEREETKANFPEIEYIDKKDISKNSEVTKAYEKIRDVTQLGSQAEWIALLAFTRPGLEQGTERIDDIKTSHIIHAIQEFGTLKTENGISFLDPEKSSREGMLVLGNLRFPIIDKTELEMQQIICDWGYNDIMEHIWFCHSPIGGKPCGICHPCRVKMETDMQSLLPKKARKRYRNVVFLEKHFPLLFSKVYKRFLEILRKSSK